MITIISSAAATLRARERDMINHQLDTLGREFPYSVGELYDCLISSRYDMELARQHCQDALAAGMQLSGYLARLSPEGWCFYG